VPIELTVQKLGDYLVPVTSADREAIESVKNGKGFRVELIQVNDRSIRHHRLYFGGLLRLVADYWETDDGLISKYDRQIMSGLIDFVAAGGNDTGGVTALVSAYLEDRAQRIKARLPENERAATKLSAIHSWIKEEAGYYDVEITPTGVKKIVKSINFNSMRTEEEFKVFYKAVFTVAWKYVLSKAGFESEQHAENVAVEMSRMG